MFGPPTPACVDSSNERARYRSQCGSGKASLSRYATISPLEANRPVLRALLRPRLGVRMTRAPRSIGDLGGRVRRAVVDHDDLVVGVVERGDAVEALADRARRVVGADDDRDARPVAVREGRLWRRRRSPPRAPASAAGRAWSGRSPSPRSRGRRGATRPSRRRRTPRRSRRRTPSRPASRGLRPAGPRRCDGCRGRSRP